MNRAIALAAERIQALGGVIDGKAVTKLGDSDPAKSEAFILGAYDLGCALAHQAGQHYNFVRACRPRIIQPWFKW
jgi:hypothetical protein